MKTKTRLQITPQIRDPSFLEKLMTTRAGENVLDCIQCGVCTGSCPASWAMDYTPMQIIRMIHLGMKDLIFSSSTIWICAMCHTCATRCPRGIDLPQLMSTLKNIALRENIQAKVEVKPKFHRSFAEIIKLRGRMHEPDLFMQITKKTDIKNMLHNALLGLLLLRKGKLKLVASEVKQKDQLLAIFNNALNEEEH
ncbi:MAG: 4Fe-4S dicluster domain-containing protein [Candidatus Bathyarchaeia archaeon]